ncbi:MAG: ATP-binding protein, partial [Planctomycetaceae bacterium]|nr:ATP-binding protein [Planctomycetaceae bacterium]
ALRSGADDFVNKSQLAEQLPVAVERLLEIAHETRRRRECERWITRQLVQFTLGNDRTQVTGLVARLCEFGLSLGAIHGQEEIRVSVALEEALLNAIIHGNLEVSSQLREEEGGAYDRLITIRQQDAHYAHRRVSIECEATRDEVRYLITDEGPGFDVTRLPDPRDPDRMLLASGRGVLMMRAFMDEVVYNERGNAVTLVKRRRTSETVRNGPERIEPSQSPVPLYAGVTA